jgi:2'-hydroxyisoflavone reductase
MKILVIGGTRFVGRHFVDAALARGHEITLFNRGQSNADLYPNVENLRGDRETDLSAFEGRHWDAVVDTCGYLPRIVRLSALELADKVDRYLFISTISVYKPPMDVGEGEDAELDTMEDPTNEEIMEHYGALKVLCEQAVEEIYGNRSLIVRPGMIVGPHDPTDRYTYWAVRIASGGEVLLPRATDRMVQMIDARDLGELMVKLLEQNATGSYNATGPEAPLTWDEWVDIFKQASGSSPTLTWVDDAFLEARELDASQLPFWFPQDYKNLFTVSVQKAIDAGLKFRSAVQTAKDTLAWREASSVADLKVGLKPDKEADLLKEWHEQKA